MNIVEKEMWSELKRLAIAEADGEAPLSALMHDRVIDHPGYAEALSHLIAASLASPVFDVDAMSDLTSEIITAHPDIATSSMYDLKAACERDPACENPLIPFLYYKGFKGLQGYRIAHALWNADRTGLARFLQSRITEVFALDIHPAAVVGRGVFIDHATGIVVGQTSVVEDDVSMLQSVTLGGTGKETGDRHPKIRRGVMLGAGAKILGNIEVGEGAKVAAGSVVTKPVPAHTTVAGVPAKPIGRPASDVPAYDMNQDLD